MVWKVTLSFTRLGGRRVGPRNVSVRSETLPASLLGSTLDSTPLPGFPKAVSRGP